MTNAMLINQLRSRGVTVVLDIGANRGQFAAGLRNAGYEGRIVSFEPLSEPFADLQRSASADSLWDCNRWALGDIDGTIAMHVAGNSGESSSVLPILKVHQDAAPYANYIGGEEVPRRRLDTVAQVILSPSDVIFVKMDVQGFEKWVFAGGAATLQKHCVGLHIELSTTPLYEDSMAINEALDLIYSSGYTMWGVNSPFSDPRDGRVLAIDGIFFRDDGLQSRGGSTERGKYGHIELVNDAIVHSPLLAYSRNVTSQCGEDGIIEHICDVLDPANRYCVEFGAWDGVYLSNTCNLIKNKKWRGVMLEADAEKHAEVVENYAADHVIALNRRVDVSGENSLDNILSAISAPTEIGVLSIDIDGNDYHIWESLKKFSAQLVVIEFNPTVPNDVIFVQDTSPQVNQGCSLLALIHLAKEKGYELVCATAFNAFFVKADKYAMFGIDDNSINTMYIPIHNERIFQGFDGTIHVVGMDTLIWKGGRRVTSDDFQILPKPLRFYDEAQR